MGTIVCGTDFTESAAAAELVARALARRLNHDVSVVHIQSEPPHHELTETARGADLLVIGAGQHREGTHWLVGSTAERVAQCTAVPLLVVREAAMFSGAVDGSRPLCIVMAADLLPESEPVIRWTAALRDAIGAHVHIVYVANTPVEYARLGIPGRMDRHTPHPQMEEVLSRELRNVASRFRSDGVDAAFTLTLGATSKELVRIAGEQHADLLVVGAHQRSRVTRAWQESVAHGVLHSAHTNVAVIPLGHD